MLRNILVPLDGSTFGEQALPLALSIAGRAGAILHLLHVHRPLEATYAEMQVFDATLNQQIRDREKAYLQATSAAVRAVAKTQVTALCKDGDIATTIKEHIENSAVDLVVMMTHGRGPMGRFWLGSTTDQLLRETPAPLLLVHPRDKEADLGADVDFKHLLIPLDGTSLAEQILNPATTLAQLWGAPLTLLRVVKPVMPMNLPVGSAASFGEMAHHMMERVDVLQEQLKKDTHSYLEQVAERLRGQGMTVDTQVAVEEQPGVAILQHAQPPIDLIALETHGRRGLSRLILGSVADKVIRGAHVPVLVQRPSPK